MSKLENAILHALILQVVLLGRNIVRQTDKLNSYGTARSEALNSHSQRQIYHTVNRLRSFLSCSHSVRRSPCHPVIPSSHHLIILTLGSTGLLCRQKYCKHVNMIFQNYLQTAELKYLFIKQAKILESPWKDRLLMETQEENQDPEVSIIPLVSFVPNLYIDPLEQHRFFPTLMRGILSEEIIIFQIVLFILGKRSRSDDGLGIFNIMRPRYG